MGMAFWTHEITAPLILTSLLMVAFKLKGQIRKYAVLTV